MDAWGRTEPTGTLPERLANNFLNPAYVSKENTTAADREVQRLYDETGEGGVVPQRPDKKITVKGTGETKYLTAQEYYAFAQERGKMAYDSSPG